MTFVKPGYRHNKNAVKRIVDGVEFLSYTVGVLRYARVSVDGKCEVRASRNHYTAEVEGHGYIMSGTKAKRFRSDKAAMAAAVKLARSLTP